MAEETYLIVLFVILAALLIFAVGVVSIVSSRKLGGQLDEWERNFRVGYERKLGEDWNRCMFGNKEGVFNGQEKKSAQSR